MKTLTFKQIQHKARSTLFIGSIALFSLGQANAAAPDDLTRFKDNPKVYEFAKEMEKQHGFNADSLMQDFAKVKVNKTVLKAIKPKNRAENKPSWKGYRNRFINKKKIAYGLQFWKKHAPTLQAASKEYGVPKEIIVAIIGIETIYGRNTGRFGVLESLSTLAFNYPPRSKFFRSELEQFLLLCRENSLDQLKITGSFAGAIGIPQFMPGSQRRHAVDFSGDGKIDLLGNPTDAIGSVARFLVNHGWQPGEHIAVQARTSSSATPKLPELVDVGNKPALSLSALSTQGILPSRHAGTQSYPNQASLLRYPTPGEATQYWLGFDNFYVITRYNHSNFYAMTVFQLAEEIAKQYNQR